MSNDPPVPAVEGDAAASSPDAIQVVDAGRELPGLSREQRAAFRRRVNLLVFAVSAAILAIAMACLLLWQG